MTEDTQPPAPQERKRPGGELSGRPFEDDDGWYGPFGKIVNLPYPSSEGWQLSGKLLPKDWAETCTQARLFWKKIATSDENQLLPTIEAMKADIMTGINNKGKMILDANGNPMLFSAVQIQALSQVYRIARVRTPLFDKEHIIATLQRFPDYQSESQPPEPTAAS